MTNKVAVLLATYNGEKYLPELFESLQAQTFRNFDIYVRDDGSSDDTLQIIKAFSERLKITVIDSVERLGAAKSFIQLLIGAGDQFDCYMFADQDDYWHPEKIFRAQSNINSTEGPMLYCAGYELVDSRLNHIAFSSPPRFITINNALVENVVTGCTVALNRHARNLVIKNLPNELMMHDWWFYIVFSALGKVVYDDYPALKYRQHPGNVVGAAISTSHDIGRRIKRFLSYKREGIFVVSSQAKEFYSCFGGFLSVPDANIVLSLVRKQTILGRLRLALGSSFVRQRSIDTFILRILFLIGRF